MTANVANVDACVEEKRSWLLLSLMEAVPANKPREGWHQRYRWEVMVHRIPNGSGEWLPCRFVERGCKSEAKMFHPSREEPMSVWIPYKDTSRSMITLHVRLRRSRIGLRTRVYQGEWEKRGNGGFGPDSREEIVLKDARGRSTAWTIRFRAIPYHEGTLRPENLTMDVVEEDEEEEVYYDARDDWEAQEMMLETTKKESGWRKIFFRRDPPQGMCVSSYNTASACGTILPMTGSVMRMSNRHAQQAHDTEGFSGISEDGSRTLTLAGEGVLAVQVGKISAHVHDKGTMRTANWRSSVPPCMVEEIEKAKERSLEFLADAEDWCNHFCMNGIHVSYGRRKTPRGSSQSSQLVGRGTLVLKGCTPEELADLIQDVERPILLGVLMDKKGSKGMLQEYNKKFKCCHLQIRSPWPFEKRAIIFAFARMDRMENGILIVGRSIDPNQLDVLLDMGRTVLAEIIHGCYLIEQLEGEVRVTMITHIDTKMSLPSFAELYLLRDVIGSLARLEGELAKSRSKSGNVSQKR